MAGVREVAVDQDLTVYEPVHETIDIDSDDTDYSVEDENPEEASAQFVSTAATVLEDGNRLHFAETQDPAIKEEPVVPAEIQPVFYNNSKYFKKQKTSQPNNTGQHGTDTAVSSGASAETSQSTCNGVSSGGIKRRHSDADLRQPTVIKDEIQEEIDSCEDPARLKEICVDKYNKIRTWRHTRLGDDINSGRRFSRAHDTKFRVMTFNVLSQHRIDRQRSAFRSKNEDHLDWAHRLEAIKREVEAVGPDVVCLQEIDFLDENTINCDIDRFMTAAGYQYHAFKRKDPKMDGCAVFYKTSVFTSEETSLVKLYNDNIESLKGSSSVGIIVRLRSRKQSSWVVVANLHLKFGKDKHLVRLAQTALFLADLNHMCTGPRGEVYPAILTGDFNLEPYTDVHRLIVKGKLKYRGLPCGAVKYPDTIFPPEFGVGHDLQWKLDGSRSTHGAGSFSHDFGFRSVYQYREERSLYLGYAPPESEVTAYQGRWVSVDHIFYSTVPSKFSYGSIDGRMEKHLKLLGKWSLPSESEIVKLGGLPSCIAPSDHLPLAAEFLLP